MPSYNRVPVQQYNGVVENTAMSGQGDFIVDVIINKNAFCSVNGMDAVI